MGAELGILSRVNPHEKLTKSQKKATHYQTTTSSLPGVPPGGSWMWNPKQPPEDDDSWEVRAFAEDTGNVMGATWPPRSYTCTFCRREFRSAQALGGHMNVHRRDRARLHQTQSPPTATTPPGSSPTFIICNQEFPANSGLCVYQLPNPNGVLAATSVSVFDHAPLALLSTSPYAGRRALLRQPLNFQAPSPPVSSSSISTSKADTRADVEFAFDSSKASIGNSNKRKDLGNEELDLELRLGHRSRNKPTI